LPFWIWAYNQCWRGYCLRRAPKDEIVFGDLLECYLFFLKRESTRHSKSIGVAWRATQLRQSTAAERVSKLRLAVNPGAKFLHRGRQAVCSAPTNDRYKARRTNRRLSQTSPTRFSLSHFGSFSVAISHFLLPLSTSPTTGRGLFQSHHTRPDESVVARWTHLPTGPWSDEIALFNPRQYGAYGQFVHLPGSDRLEMRRRATSAGDSEAR
jgi:hypothetical protein